MTGLFPFLSSWDRDQENSAFVGRELFRQAYSTLPDLYRPSSEQAKRAGPNMTDEGHTPSRHSVVESLSALAADSRLGAATNYNTPVRHGITLAHEGRAAHAPFGVDSLANRAVEMCGTPAIPSSLVSHYTSSNPSKGQLTGETRADCMLARPP